MSQSAILDHMVINVRFEMDLAEAVFGQLGFVVTPRGFHSLGSINHLMIYVTDYLELLGLPAGQPPRRAEIADAPVGLNGLVFKTDDVKATYDRLVQLDMAGDPPKSFSRPVDVGDSTKEAGFSTVTVRGDVFEAGRVYFCQHHTPELVWRPQWQEHANATRSTNAFVVVARDAEREAARYGQLLGLAVGARSGGEYTIDLNGSVLSIMGPDEYAGAFGGFALPYGNRTSLFGAVRLRVDSLEEISEIASSGVEGCRFRVDDGRVLVAIERFETLLEFVL